MDPDQIRKVVFAYMQAHELQHHGGRACLRERVNLVAFLCHSLGVTKEHLGQLSRQMAAYDTSCPCPVPNFEEEPCL